MHNNSNMRNKQMEVNICKILPLFKISRTHAWKWPLFLDFAPFIEKKTKKKNMYKAGTLYFFNSFFGKFSKDFHAAKCVFFQVDSRYSVSEIRWWFCVN